MSLPWSHSSLAPFFSPNTDTMDFSPIDSRETYKLGVVKALTWCHMSATESLNKIH